MRAILETHRRLYNDALSEREEAWELAQRSVFYGEQSGQLKAARTTNPFLAATNFSSCQATLRRLDKAFQAFFRRIRTGQTPGYPRFKGRNRFDTVEFADRVHGCSHCGYVADRNVNAAQNILRLGSSLQDKTCADGQCVS